VQDVVHGRIWLTKLERRLVDTPEFQRLRHISQLGLANYVFPTATHSRLAHSLGATHVMGWMLRQRTLQDYFREREELIPVLRLAALLHDIGHYPFSHLGEAVYSAIERGAVDEREKNGLSIFDVAATRGPVHSSASHETLTAEVIRETRIAELINNELGQIGSRDASEVLIDIIGGTYPDAVCHSLISSDLDCDRLDYLVRDSASAGLTYGQVDLAYLIENLRIETHARFGPMLVVDASHGFGAVEHYLHARYFHYARFITHKTIASAELLLAVVMLELARLRKLKPRADDIKSLVGTPKLLWFTDQYVWTLLTEATDAGWASSDLKEAANSLLRRTLMKCACSVENLETDSTEERSYECVHLDKLFSTVEQKASVAKGSGVDGDQFCYQKRPIRLAGLPARVTPKPGSDEKYDLIETVSIAEPGAEPRAAVLEPGLLQQLSVRRWVTRRVFVREPDAPESGLEKTQKLRSYFAQELTH
jgi:HD superfamily phosphohydrolase